MKSEPTGVAWTCPNCRAVNHEPWNAHGIYACIACATNGPFEIVYAGSQLEPDFGQIAPIRDGQAMLAGEIGAWICRLRAADDAQPAEIRNALKELAAWVAELERLLAAAERASRDETPSPKKADSALALAGPPDRRGAPRRQKG